MLEINPNQLSRILGINVSEIKSEPVVNGGAHSRIYACKSEIGDLILRICKGQQGFYTHYFPDKVNPDDWMDHRWAIESARSVGVPAPEIIYSDRAQRWSVMKRLPGTPIDSEYELWDRCPYDEKEFGALLVRLHSTQPSGFGPIDDQGRTLFSTWLDFLLQAAASALSTCLSRKSLPLVLAKQLEERWLPKLSQVDLKKPSLLHMEALGFANIMYEPETRTITGLLDYEDCIGGDPLFEICWMKFYFEYGSQDQHYFDFGRFAAGYGELELDSERIALYSPFTFLDKLRWIEQDSDSAKGYVRKLKAFIKQGC